MAKATAILIMFAMIVAACGGTSHTVESASPAEAAATYLWSADDGVMDELLLVERADQRGADLLPGVSLRSSTPDLVRGGRGERIIWSDEATEQDRLALEARAAELGLDLVIFLGIEDFWPSCDNEVTPGECPIVAELFLPEPEVEQLLREHVPERLDYLAG